MIISASYKTDIPAFYGEWFCNRLRAGFCRMENPFNRNQTFSISLRREDVDGFVFWTKNLLPFSGILDDLGEQGFPIIVQFTITGYPRALESRVIDSTRSVEQFRSLARRFGSRAAIWRYDPIILSTLTDLDFHRENFARLASQLSGATDEVVVSFLQIYEKTRRNLDQASSDYDFRWEDPAEEEKRQLLAEFVTIASDHKMNLKVCTQPHLVVSGAGEARCIDAQRLIDVSGRYFRSKLRGMRKDCGCFESKDVGDYDTCPHGCVYCYAVRDRTLAARRYRAHDPSGEYLFSQHTPREDTATAQEQESQLSLFRDNEP